MFGGSILNILPAGLLSWAASQEGKKRGPNVLTVATNGRCDDDGIKKRRRDGESIVGSRTPTLVSTRRVSRDDVASTSCGESPLKRIRTQHKGEVFHKPYPISPPPKLVRVVLPSLPTQTSEFLNTIPEDVISHCLSFVGTSEDRFALQTACRTFRKISNADTMLARVDLGGDRDTGQGGIIQDHSTPATAAAALAPFARGLNLEALYMLGLVKCYCYQNLNDGIRMLKVASSHGYVRSSYTLGVILRDALPSEAARYMRIAASMDYFPALQELLSGREMKHRFGEPSAEELRKFLDPPCLNRLLLADYIESTELRGLNTSHCWNPLCGKWAHKTYSSNSSARTRRPWGYVFDQAETDVVVDLSNTEGPPPLQARRIPEPGPARRHEPLNVERRPLTAHSCVCPPIDSPSRRKRKFVNGDAPDSSLAWQSGGIKVDRVSRMRMCSRCCRAKYCSKLCQVYDWRSSQHKMECQFL